MPVAPVPDPPWTTGTWLNTSWEEGTWGPAVSGDSILGATASVTVRARSASVVVSKKTATVS